jgi:predicted dinucleotide-binding enzyme
MKVGVLGSGDVAKALGAGFLKHGHEVMLGTRAPAKLAEWAKQSPKGRLGGFAEAAKKMVSGLLAQFGWDTADMGKVEAARAIEPLCMLWCIPGFLRNNWIHAFKLLT